MILADTDIKKALQAKIIKIDPPLDLSTQLSACSIDLRLHNEFQVFEYSNMPYIDLRAKKLHMPTKKITVTDKDIFILQPKEFVLASTIESLTLPPHIAGRLEGRSSIGRLGIVVHSTASFIEPGFSGRITLELGNIGMIPVALYPGLRVCAISFEELSAPAETPYDKRKTAKYQGQKGPVLSKIHLD